MQNKKSSPNTGLLFLVVVLLTLLVYYTGLSGGFLFDDATNIVQNDKLRITSLESEQWRQAAFSSHSGQLMRPVSMASFALNYYISGLNPFYFKLTNLLIHLLNGVGLFLLGALLLKGVQRHLNPDLTEAQIKWISFMAAAAWLLHPFAMTSVLYIVQRMTSLSALFTIWGLVCYVCGRLKLDAGSRGGISLMLLGFLLFGALATFSKENGLLLPLYMLVIEVAIFRFETVTTRQRNSLASFYGLTVVVPALLIGIYLFMKPEGLLSGYQIRDFTLTERLLTQARVVWWYLQMIVYPDVRSMGLFHDDIAISTGLFQPVSTIVAVTAWLFVVLGGVFFRKKFPLAVFGLLFFVAGHAMESTIFPLEIAHEHRNYLPMYGISLAVFFYAQYWMQRVKSTVLTIAIPTVILGALAMSTTIRAASWGNPIEMALVEVAHHPNSASANYEAGRRYADLMSGESDPQRKGEYYNLAFQYLRHSAELSETNNNGLFGLVVLGYMSGKGLDVDALKRLKYRLQNVPFGASNVNYLGALLECHKKGLCVLPKAEMLEIFQVSLLNPSLIGIHLASVLTYSSKYLADNTEYYQNALDLSYAAVKAAPYVMQFRMNLVSLLLSLGKLDAAQIEINSIKKLDKLRVSDIQIREQESYLAKMRQAH